MGFDGIFLTDFEFTCKQGIQAAAENPAENGPGIIRSVQGILFQSSIHVLDGRIQFLQFFITHRPGNLIQNASFKLFTPEALTLCPAFFHAILHPQTGWTRIKNHFFHISHLLQSFEMKTMTYSDFHYIHSCLTILWSKRAGMIKGPLVTHQRP